MGRSSAPPLNGKLIQKARLRMRLTQAELGRKCAEHGHELDQAYISRIENGQIRWPTLKCLPVIAEVLGVEVDDLFEEEDGEPNGKAA